MLLELGLPGLVFLGLCFWLVKKVLYAARTERDLEAERLSGALADELRAARARAAAKIAGEPQVVPPPAPEPPRDPLAAADLRGADPEHVRLVLELVEHRRQDPVLRGRIEVAWVRSSDSHIAWCERRLPAIGLPRTAAREVICVARVEGGAIAERWSFG